MTQLNGLMLNNNGLTGSIPSELGLLTQLTSLSLFNNELTGSIPYSLCSCAFALINCGELEIVIANKITVACRCYYLGRNKSSILESGINSSSSTSRLQTSNP